MEYMTANYHTHTWRCRHASGTEREYIELAMQMGIRELGFSDHVPFPADCGYVSGIRMGMEQAPEYVQTIRQLGREYRGRIRLYVGFEAEYIKEYFDDQMYMFRMLDCDYLIMGQHFLGNEADGCYTGTPTRDEGRIREYVDTVIAGMETGCFLYLAHPDMMNYQGLDSVYDWEMTRMCSALKEMDIPLELNMNGMSSGRNYPSERFWRLAGEVGNKVLLGIDAHSTEQMADTVGYKGCMDIVDKYNLNLIKMVNIKGAED
ncbi:MAG: histidinol-phosphatase [Muribaculaceae bacterium]|nr:histidinol-phosphatase [Muribaculaceae bacterium]MCM1492098.1 histidinol-phosphatase [Muribaculaceae bacterium]